MNAASLLFISVLITLVGFQVHSSPFSGFSSSESRNFYRVSPWIKYGIQWQIKQTDWEAASFSQASSTVKFENSNLKQSMDFKILTDKKSALPEFSAKNFSQFGFNLLKTQLVGNIDVIDLFHPEQKIQVRQYFFRNSKQRFLITCSSPPQIFSQTVIKCNNAALGVRWKPLAAEPAFHFGSNSSDKTSVRR